MVNETEILSLLTIGVSSALLPEWDKAGQKFKVANLDVIGPR